MIAIPVNKLPVAQILSAARDHNTIEIIDRK
jgi:hypothetical protein